MFNTIIKDSFPITGEYEWFEINPFVCGSDYLDGFIPTKYFGSKFQDGVCIKIRPEESIGYFLGIFGSPYNFNIGDLLLQIVQSIPEKFVLKYQIINYVHSFIKEYDFAKINVLPSKISNPTYKMSSSQYQEKFLTLADAGFDFDISIPPLLKRKVDIIICCDDSSDACKKGFPELKMAKRYANYHGFKFPSLKYYTQITSNLFIFDCDENGKINRKIPTIIYFINPIQESMLKMQYSKKEFDNLCDYMKNMVIKNKTVISQAIIQKVNYKSF